MFSFYHESKFRIRYSETDKMGYCYHGNYAAFFEVGRVEALRTLGISYAEWETQGILLPVLSMETHFVLPLKYDELVTMVTELKEVTRAKLLFNYRLYNQDSQLVTTAHVTLVCVDAVSKKPRSIPSSLTQSLQSYEI